MRSETLFCDRCRKPALALVAVDDMEVCPNCLPGVVSDATRHGLIAVRLEYAQPIAAPVRMRARR